MRVTLLKQFKLAVSPRSSPAARTQMEQRAHTEQAGPSALVALQGLGSSRLQGTPPLFSSRLGWEENKHNCLGIFLLGEKTQAKC